ncbi:MAG: alpha-hydroxy-acid oxidizing protein [Betaproteobacteria bacterium]|nr:alpha-hydroxy-acid oxidizing protein [Betaproteobacteria bacterium]
MPELSRAYNIEDLRCLAQRSLPRSVFDFFDGGAEDEATLRANREAFQRVRLMPKVLVDVANVDTKLELFGRVANYPVAISPVGAAGFGRPDADIAIARAAAKFGIPFTLSTAANASIERVAREAGGRLWFQLYPLKDHDFAAKLVERARQAEYEALLVTVDLPVGGKRERDFRNQFTLPFRYTGRNVLDFASRPAWALRLLRHGVPRMENLEGFVPQSEDTATIALWVGKNLDASFDWNRLKALRDTWPRKLLVKGVVRADDAERIAQLGCDGVVVSNHGGRQLDGAIATLDALPAIARAVGSKLTVLIDSGVRRGGDALKACALGAQAVMIGRATLYGASAAGESGALRALEILADELERSMRLCGTRAIAEIGPHLLAGN